MFNGRETVTGFWNDMRGVRVTIFFPWKQHLSCNMLFWELKLWKLRGLCMNDVGKTISQKNNCLFVCLSKRYIDVFYSSVAKWFSVLLNGKQTAQLSFHNSSLFVYIYTSLSLFCCLSPTLSSTLALCFHKTGTVKSRETDSTFTQKGYPPALQPNSCHVFWEHYSAFEILPW